MPRLARSRVRRLERRTNLDGPPVGRLLFLAPDLWPEADQEIFHGPHDPVDLEALIERRTGVTPTFGMNPVWAITVPASQEMLAMTDEEKAAFLERCESRPLRPDHWNWRRDAVGDATEGGCGQAPP